MKPASFDYTGLKLTMLRKVTMKWIYQWIPSQHRENLFIKGGIRVFSDKKKITFSLNLMGFKSWSFNRGVQLSRWSFCSKSLHTNTCPRSLRYITSLTLYVGPNQKEQCYMYDVSPHQQRVTYALCWRTYVLLFTNSYQQSK